MPAKMFFALLVMCFVSIAPFTASADEKAEAATFVNNIGKRALAVITDKSMSKEEKNVALEKMFVESVDINWIGRYVLGRTWKTLADEKKQKYMSAYRDFLVAHYTSNFAEFTNANFEVTRVVPDDSGGNIITMRIKRPQAEDIIVDYDIRKSSDGNYKVYDIIVEGVSMITTQRSDFTSVISQNGFDYLVSQLVARTHQQGNQPQ